MLTGCTEIDLQRRGGVRRLVTRPHQLWSITRHRPDLCRSKNKNSTSVRVFKVDIGLIYTRHRLEFNCLWTLREDSLQEPCGLNYQQLGNLSDEQLMMHLGAGHGDAVAVLLDRYSRLVLSITSQIVHDHGEVEDLVQEIFVELCRTAAQFKADKGTAKMWIIRLAYRRSLNRRRHVKFRDSHLLQDMGELENTPNSEFTGVPTMSMNESRLLAKQMLGSLDAAQRRILELVFFEGLTMQDVAERTGDTFASVRHRYYRAMRKLREVMQQPHQAVAPSAAQETLNAKT